ncbi:MAG: hypothetical protein J6A78_06020 [Clostridia bacterium]|nr:hypothetical protein [Clostridia bacterium]
MQEIINDGALNGIKPEEATKNRKNVVFAIVYAGIMLVLFVCVGMTISLLSENETLTEMLRYSLVMAGIVVSINLPLLTGGVLAILTKGKTSRLYKVYTVIIAIFNIISAAAMFFGMGILLNSFTNPIWFILGGLVYCFIVLAAAIIPLFKRKQPEDDSVSPKKHNRKMLLLFWITLISFLLVGVVVMVFFMGEDDFDNVLPDTLLFLFLLYLPGLLLGTLAFVLKNGFATFFAVINQILSIVCILATSPIVFASFLGFFFLPPVAVIILGIWFNLVEVNLFLFLFVFRRKKFPKKEKVTALPMTENQEAEQIL